MKAKHIVKKLHSFIKFTARLLKFIIGKKLFFGKMKFDYNLSKNVRKKKVLFNNIVYDLSIIQ